MFSYQFEMKDILLTVIKHETKISGISAFADVQNINLLQRTFQIGLLQVGIITEIRCGKQLSLLPAAGWHHH